MVVMRSALLFVALLPALATQAIGQSGFCPPTPTLGDDNFSEHWLEGTIDAKSVRMYLARGGDTAIGVFYYTEDWDPVMLGGEASHGGVIHVTDKTDESPATGSLHGRLTASGFVGAWAPVNSSKSLPVRLKVVPKPHCEAVSGKSRRFDDQRWPVTFSYPTSWKVEIGQETLTLTCPDPSLMAYEGFNITMTQGRWTGVELSDIGLASCGDRWYSLRCECEDLTGPFCDKAAIVSKKDGMTVISGIEQEWRGYCRGGGYVGQADGDRRILLLKDKWVNLEGQGSPSELLDQIVTTIKTRP